MTLSTEVIIYQHFEEVNYILLAFVRLKTLALSEHLLWEYFTSFCYFGLVGVKIHKIKKMLFFILPNPKKFVIQINPLI